MKHQAEMPIKGALWLIFFCTLALIAVCVHPSWGQTMRDTDDLENGCDYGYFHRDPDVPKVLAEWKSIQNGMTLAQVDSIYGEHGVIAETRGDTQLIYYPGLKHAGMTIEHMFILGRQKWDDDDSGWSDVMPDWNRMNDDQRRAVVRVRDFEDQLINGRDDCGQGHIGTEGKNGVEWQISPNDTAYYYRDVALYGGCVECARRLIHYCLASNSEVDRDSLSLFEVPGRITGAFATDQSDRGNMQIANVRFFDDSMAKYQHRKFEDSYDYEFRVAEWNKALATNDEEAGKRAYIKSGGNISPDDDVSFDNIWAEAIENYGNGGAYTAHDLRYLVYYAQE